MKQETCKFTPYVLKTIVIGDPERIDEMMQKVDLNVKNFLVYFETEDGMKVIGKFE